MTRLVKGRSKKAGLPPGTLVHIGAKKTGRPKITVIDYSEGELEEKTVERIEECFLLREKPTVTWIDIDGLHEIEILSRLGECYGIHPLVLEDILHTDQRPKVEDYGDYLYIVLRMLREKERGAQVESEQVSLILGPNFVFSFQEREGDVFDPIRERLRAGKGRLRALGADYLAYALLDALVDRYFIILEKLGEEIEILEDALITNPESQTLQKIHHLRRETIFLRRAVWPLREVLSSLQRGDSPLVEKTTALYLRDVYDHSVQAIETIETFRDMLSGMVEIYMSNVSNRLNSVMKVLTIIATVFMPLTFLAGIYGMNFKHMPELEWRWGYLVTWIVMIGIGLGMLYAFKKKKWV